MITINMTKAKDIKRDMIRAERKEAFKDLDLRSMRALESGDTEELALVNLEKQKLRDAPAHPSIDQAATPDELKAITLQSLT